MTGNLTMRDVQTYAETLADAILELWSPALRQQMRATPRERVERFSRARAEKRMQEMYAELLQAKGCLPKEI